jgi:hypothetical protein
MSTRDEMVEKGVVVKKERHTWWCIFFLIEKEGVKREAVEAVEAVEVTEIELLLLDNS